MKKASSSLIANIFGNRFVFDQDWLSGLSEKMLSTMSHDKVEEFFTDVYSYFSDRGWYNIPNVQHLPNTHVTRSGVEFYASVFSLYGNDDRFIIPRTFRPYTLWYARKTYLYRPLYFDATNEDDYKWQKHKFDYNRCQFRLNRSESNTPFFERAKIFYYDKPYIAAGLMQKKSYIGNSYLDNSLKQRDNNQRYRKDDIWIFGRPIDLNSVNDKDADMMVLLRNDFVTEPHYNTQINKFIDFLLLFEGTELQPLLRLFGRFDNLYHRDNVMVKSRYLNVINDLGSTFISARNISRLLRNAAQHYKKYESQHSTNRELLTVTKSEILWKGSLFESICGILSYSKIDGYRLLPFSQHHYSKQQPGLQNEHLG